MTGIVPEEREQRRCRNLRPPVRDMGLRVAPEGERELTQDWLQTSQPRRRGLVSFAPALPEAVNWVAPI